MARGIRRTLLGVSGAGLGLPVNLAVKDDAEALFLFGRDSALSSRNRVPGKPNGVWTGAGSFEDGSAAFDPAAVYLTTAVPDSAAMTIFCLVRSDETVPLTNGPDPYFWSTNLGASREHAGNINGLSLRIEANTGALTLFVPRHDAGTPQNQTLALSGGNAPPAGSWSLFCARFDHTMATLNDLGRGKSNTAASAYVRDRTVNALRIGARYQGVTSGLGTHEGGAWMGYSRMLTDPEMLAQAAQILGLATQNGLSHGVVLP